jgi:amidase
MNKVNLNEFSSYDGLGLAELVKTKEVKAEELVELSIKGIEKVNPKLNGVVHVIEEEALKEIRSGLPKGDFEGVPFLLKEIICHAKDIPQSMGSRFAEGFTFPIDSFLMERFRKAGFVTVGTTTTPEFAFNATTESLLYGPTHNPWELGHSPGGSSGGAAVSVASGIVPIAHANDGGGSIRIPASCSGIVGLKPTRGRVTFGPYNSEPINGLGIEFGLTKTIRDTASLLDAVSMEQPGEYCYAPKPLMPYKEIINQPVSKLRIAYSRKTASGYPVSDEVLKALDKTVELLKTLGHEVIEDSPIYDANAYCQATTVIWTSNLYKMIKTISQMTGRTPSEENIEATVWNCYLEGKEMKASELLGAIETNGMITRSVGEFFTGYDVFLTPTISSEPIKHGVLNSNNPNISPFEFTKQMLLEIAPFTSIFNTTGQPAISLPLYMSKNGLPIGMQFAGHYGDESTLLQLGVQLEEALPWKTRTPKIHVSN